MEHKIMNVADIIPAAYNPRIKLTKKDYEYQCLDKSIDEFGFVVPLIVNKRNNTLISGHQRLEVLKQRGITEIDVVLVDFDEAQEKALCIAMNKIEGQWDYGKLADILEELHDSEIDITCTGFSEKEICELLGYLNDYNDDIDIETVPGKEDTESGVLCVIGEYRFRITDDRFNRVMADVREKVGFSKEMVAEEFKRRLLR